MWSSIAYLGHARPIAEAHGLFLEARNREALAALGRDRSHAAVFLRARCLLRLSDPGHVLTELRGYLERELPVGDCIERDILVGTALRRTGDLAGSQCRETAVARVACTVGGAALAEALLFRARGACDGDRLGAAEQLATAGTAVAWLANDSYPRALRTVRAQSFITLAYVRSAQERHAEQADALECAWREQDALGTAARDRWIDAAILRDLALLVWDVNRAREAGFLAREARRFPWSSDTAEARWIVERALGWNAALNGDDACAFARLRDAVDLAPTAADRLASTLDRAYLARELGQTIIAGEEMMRAYRMAAAIRWDGVHAGAAHVLLDVVEAYAREDADIAAFWLSTYTRIRAAARPSTASLERRRGAMEQDARAAVAAAARDAGTAVALRRAAGATWLDLGQTWRAARSAVALALVSSQADDIAQARRLVRPFRASWLGRAARRLGRPSPTVSGSP